MYNDDYIPVVAVRYSEASKSDHYYRSICIVPNSAMLSTGDAVIIEAEKYNERARGVCESDTLFVDRNTLEMICRVLSRNAYDLPTIAGKITIDWYTNKEVDNEQALL